MPNPYPEAITGTPWRIEANTERVGRTDQRRQWMTVPVDDSPAARAIQYHELLHVALSLPEPAHHRHGRPLDWHLVQGIEDARNHTIAVTRIPGSAAILAHYATGENIGPLTTLMAIYAAIGAERAVAALALGATRSGAQPHVDAVLALADDPRTPQPIRRTLRRARRATRRSRRILRARPSHAVAAWLADHYTRHLDPIRADLAQALTEAADPDAEPAAMAEPCPERDGTLPHELTPTTCAYGGHQCPDTEHHHCEHCDQAFTPTDAQATTDAAQLQTNATQPDPTDHPAPGKPGKRPTKKRHGRTQNTTPEPSDAIDLDGTPGTDDTEPEPVADWTAADRPTYTESAYDHGTAADQFDRHVRGVEPEAPPPVTDWNKVTRRTYTPNETDPTGQIPFNANHPGDYRRTMLDTAADPHQPLPYIESPQHSNERACWGRMTIVHPDHPTKVEAEHNRPSPTGLVPRYISRVHTNGRAFAHRRPLDRARPGTVLCDDSGSMSLTNEELDRLLVGAPYATVACYSGSGGHGVLTILARNGRRVPTSAGRTHYQGNEVDGPALDWLAEQPGPRYWITDGGVCSDNGSRHACLDSAAAKVRRGHVTRFDDIDAACRAFGA